MKNKTFMVTVVTMGALVLMAFGNVASANSKLGLGVSGDFKGEFKDRVGINAGVKADANISHDRDDRDDDGDKDKDRSLPPGIEKKIDALKDTPKDHWPTWLGWFRHWFDKSTTTPPKVVRPVIKDLNIVASTTSATISWGTSASTTGEVKFGTDSDLRGSTTVVADSSMSMTHSVTLSGLSANTTYYFTVSVKDADGNVKTSEVKKFHTKAVVEADVTAPTIFFSAGVGTSSTTAHILWMTNERADSRVWISTSDPVDVSGTATVSASGLLYVHDMSVTGLSADTTYHFAVRSADAEGNLSVASMGSFTTRE